MSKVLNKHIQAYENLNLPWYERDGLLTYIEQLNIRALLKILANVLKKLKLSILTSFKRNVWVDH